MSIRGRDERSRVWIVLALAVVCLVIAALSPQVAVRLPAALAALTLVCLTIVLRLMSMVQAWRRRKQEAQLALLVGQDASPCFLTDELGQISFQNDVARARYGERDGKTLIAAMNDHFASPSSVLSM